MGGRLIDWLGAGLDAARPLAASVPALIAPNGTALYFSTDTGAINFFDPNAVAWVTPIVVSTEQIQDIFGAMIVNGTGMSVVYNDPAGTVTFTCNVTQYTNEMAMDAIAAMLAAGIHSGITVTYNDAGDAMSLAISGNVGLTRGQISALGLGIVLM